MDNYISVINGQILKPYQKFLKFFGMPFLGFIGFVIFAFMSGMSGNKYHSTNPTVIELGFPVWLILFCMLVFFIIIALLIRFYSFEGIDYGSQIRFNNNEIKVETDDYLITFNVNKAQSIKFSESHLIQLLFYKYYIVGKLRIRYEGDSFCFYFSVKNPTEERHIQKCIKK